MSDAAATGDPFRRLISAVDGSSRAIPSEQDFHFYNNFGEFRHPILQISSASQSALSAAAPPFPPDLDDAYDRLVDANDTYLERFDAALDELRSNSNSSDGFQLVLGKKKKKSSSATAASETEVKVATTEAAAVGPKKPKVPFHIPTIPRPQDRFSIFVNNVNQPFEHVWLQKSDDLERFIHPLEKVSVLDLVDADVSRTEPVKPPSVESTSFKLVEEVQDLKELAAKLRNVDEFAVDLEHNQYRSFQGLTCLIQISTRTEDFVIDALKLRIQIGPYLREVFKDPTKRKVMHGAERDIIWLQRDFGIYVCNMFDTGQASRVLKLERHSLEYLLDHFCGVTANKEYQNADWRLRPVPPEMLRYAREDTHYLLHIYDLMRIELVAMSKESENPKASLLEVYNRSYDICMQLYEKELLTQDSYLYIYGLQGADLNAQQLAVVAGLFEWRDVIARAEDESTGYILPNKALLEIAKQMPDTTSKLRRLVKSKHLYLEHNLGSVVSIIKNSMKNAAAYEAAVEILKDARVARGSQEYLMATDEPEVGKVADASPESISAVSSASPSGGSSVQQRSGSEKIDTCIPSSARNENIAVSDTTTSFSRSVEVTGATVQVQKKPNRAFGALFGNSVSKKRLDLRKDTQEAKLEQIRASVQFPLHFFSGSAIEQSNVYEETPAQVPISDQPASVSSTTDAIIMLKGDSDVEESGNGDLGTSENGKDPDEPMSLSDLSSSFEQCFDKYHRRKKLVQVEKPQPVEPFDYEAKRKAVFGEKSKENKIEVERNHSDSKGKKKTERAVKGDDDAAEFARGRRRKAFPASGNRSFTFR